jgi:hypothetical protein
MWTDRHTQTDRHYETNSLFTQFCGTFLYFLGMGRGGGGAGTVNILPKATQARDRGPYSRRPVQSHSLHSRPVCTWSELTVQTDRQTDGTAGHTGAHPPHIAYIKQTIQLQLKGAGLLLVPACVLWVAVDLR